jgi:glutathione synthase/RimK-type ligase-like ATP-grasp enzyme
MSNILVLYPNCCSDSAEELASFIGADRLNPFEAGRRDLSNYEHVFNYGCNRNIVTHGTIINTPKAVATCIDKVATLQVMKMSGVPHIAFCTAKREIPNTWKTIVVRPDACGHGGTSLAYANDVREAGEAQLYTEYYKHKFEFRIVVFKGRVIARLLKEEKNGRWNLNSMDKYGFDSIDKAAIKASKALGIDYAGFDVLSNGETKFKFIEANSGPIICGEALLAIKEHYNNV